ncbi:MAG: isopentenyl-diphosphate delta-isomerase, partial [Pseudorhodobacter sp.]
MDNDLIPAWLDGDLRPLDKLDVHRRGLRHLAVSVFVLSAGKVLIQQRAAGKYHTPNLWANTCCTHPHWGETAA